MINRLKQRVGENFAHPRGVLGRIAGRVMATRASNTERGRWAVAELDPAPDARVLEIGYGPGVALAHMGRRLAEGTLIGVDGSAVMRRQATRRNAQDVKSGRLELRVGDAQQLDADLADFALIYAINVWQFWTDQATTVALLARRLSVGGRLGLVYMQPPIATMTGDQARDKMVVQFAAARLVDIETRVMDFDPPAVMVIGRRA